MRRADRDIGGSITLARKEHARLRTALHLNSRTDGLSEGGALRRAVEGSYVNRVPACVVDAECQCEMDLTVYVRLLTGLIISR